MNESRGREERQPDGSLRRLYIASPIVGFVASASLAMLYWVALSTSEGALNVEYAASQIDCSQTGGDLLPLATWGSSSLLLQAVGLAGLAWSVATIARLASRRLVRGILIAMPPAAGALYFSWSLIVGTPPISLGQDPGWVWGLVDQANACMSLLAGAMFRVQDLIVAATIVGIVATAVLLCAELAKVCDSAEPSVSQIRSLSKQGDVLLAIASTILVAGVGELIALVNYGASVSARETSAALNAAKAAGTMAGAAYSVVLASVYLPVALWRHRCIQALAKVETGPVEVQLRSLSDVSEWANKAGVGEDVLRLSTRILLLVGPLLAGTLGDAVLGLKPD